MPHATAPSSRSVQTNPNVKIIKIPTKIQDPDQCTTTQRHVDRRANQAKQAANNEEAPQLSDAAATIAAAVIFFLTEMVVPMAICKHRRERECVTRECISTSQMNAANNEEAMFSSQKFSYSVHHIESSNICIEH